jgi:hypothetical protein
MGAIWPRGGEWKNSFGKGAQWMMHARFTAAASSVLKETDGTEHVAENITDWGRDTAWVEGHESDGLGESITVTLTKSAKVSRIGIVNGYAKSRDLYFANNRAMLLKVSVNGGKPFDVEIPDEYLEHEHFWFDLPKSFSLVKTVKLEIAAIHPGTRYKDTAISDIDLLVKLEKAPKIQPSR